MHFLSVSFDSGVSVEVPPGTLLVEAARLAGVDVMQPCGGQGRCGRCAVQVLSGNVRRRSTLRLTPEDVQAGWALACQTVVESDVNVHVPAQEKIERRLTTDRTVAEVSPPSTYNPRLDQVIRRVGLSLTPPRLDDQSDDLSRLKAALRSQAGFTNISVSLPLLRRLGSLLRDADWQATAIIALQEDESGLSLHERLIDLLPGHREDWDPLWGVAVDIGTTTVTLWLVDLVTGRVVQQVSEYNRQIARGEDVISRIIYASKNGSGDEMRQLVLETINSLVETACNQAEIRPQEIVKATITGNSAMIHLLLGIPAASIRLSPFVTAVNHPPLFSAREVGLEICPEAVIDCLPGVASYVGADISAGVLSSGMDDSGALTLFLDVGTNGEMVLGSRDWLVTCACSAGPAFEGAGVAHGMRATRGAIEEVWINAANAEPSFRVIGGGKPAGICGSGLISLLAELFMTGVIDKAGRFDPNRNPDRIRQGEHGLEYVLAWADQSAHSRDITLTHVDIDNLLRAKAAIFAGFSVLAQSVGLDLESVEQVLIGGSFGRYINIEKAIQIGLLPDLPWDRFQFLGNTSVRGAYLALLDRRNRDRIKEIAERMTYIELSADNSFYEAFMSAMFLPHTDLSRFPSIATALQEKVNTPAGSSAPS